MKNFEIHFAEIYSVPSESSYDSGYEGVYDQFVFYDEEDCLDEFEEFEDEDSEDEEDYEILDDCFVYFPGSDEIGIS